jgi:two-component system KDP operon response regulator KdpE
MIISATPRTSSPELTVLLVEDEVRAQGLIYDNLEPLGFHVVALSTGDEVDLAIEKYHPAIVLLDIKLPTIDGFEVCQRIRRVSSVPIIMLSGLSQLNDKLRAFALGADDYVTKPYEAFELAARVDAVLRRVTQPVVEQQPLFSNGPLTMDFSQRKAWLNGCELLLSPTEYRLLKSLALDVGRTLVADVLLTKVWGPKHGCSYGSLHLNIGRLRRKLGEEARNPHLIVSRRGIGYMMPILSVGAE